MHYCKVLLLGLVLVLTSCGQPLAMRTSPRATSTTTQPPPLDSAVPLVTPDSLAATLSLSTPTALLATPTSDLATTPLSTVVVLPKLPATPTNEERWHQQLVDLTPFEEAQTYTAQTGVSLFWFDPRTNQTLEVGAIVGEFRATASFTWRATNQPALLVPYDINSSYGLTAISDALVQRMSATNPNKTVEAFVFVSDAVQPK